MIKADEIKKIAHLAKIQIEQKEFDQLAKQISDIMKYAEIINELDLKGIEPTSHAVAVDNIFRADIAIEANIINEAIKQAPEQAEHFFRVPKVI
ncbi:asparaginyl/glutamyl-tRNA amidotransferase subunit C [bacterium K02(2017)]|nr:asparaginyl/glutamyl-tRNA amidotransferase subunit C [bacterium K02(2017)]